MLVTYHVYLVCLSQYMCIWYASYIAMCIWYASHIDICIWYTSHQSCANQTCVFGMLVTNHVYLVCLSQDVCIWYAINQTSVFGMLITRHVYLIC